MTPSPGGASADSPEGRPKERPDTALACLAMVARHHGVDLGVERMVHDTALAAGEAVGTPLLLRIAREKGFKAKAAKLRWEDLTGLGDVFPVIARLANCNSVVLAGFRETAGGGADAVIVDPLADRPDFVFVPRDRLVAAWHGEIVFIAKVHTLSDRDQPFGLRWFAAEMLRQRRDFTHIAVAGLMLHVIGLVTPLFFQVVVDKVLVHSSWDTLTVLGIGVSIAVLFESALGFLRGYLLLFTTNRIDIRLSTQVFGHLIRLPLSFFETSSAGVVTKHMQQIEKVREFLTGKLFTAVLDSWALLVFLPMMMAYSMTMAMVVLFFSALVAATVLLVMPWFRRELHSLYAAEGQRQALLVETIHGASTVKALALEPSVARRWADDSALAIGMQQRVGRVSLSAQSAIGLLEKLLTIAVVWIGAAMVFDGALTIGELVAIQMLAGRVSGPLVQIVSLAYEFQQAGLSVRMLGEIMARRTESGGARNGLRPRFREGIVLDGATFTYPGTATPALDRVEIAIPPGAMVGVVGRSGSGKTTFLRLLQGTIMPSSGHIRYDGVDIRELDLAHLRRNMGVVLQESFIFRGTARENIAMTRPGAPFEQVVRAAREAGADEFIQRLPQGYDTMLEENASNLSGGQKQRLAIARALLSRPPILILDEATSALDPESEAIIQDNMAQIARGRTVISVSHRLSTLTRADMILVFDQGRVVASGSHARLLETCGLYRQLWLRQNAPAPPLAAARDAAPWPR